MKKKYIHYCWFGNNPLPKLAKKCIESWKKYLPDYEIIKWSEENVDINECPFIKEAYENKKWAFVADYARTKAIYEMGGIYFDTDMEITKNIDFLLDNKTFIGVEDSGMIACGVWGEQEKESYLSKKMLEFYRNMEHFPIDDLYSISIPRLITNILKPLGFNMCNVNEIQKLEKEIYVYPREFFYPYSYNRDNNCFTDNTCMIHYYDASWVPKWERRENKIYRMFGKEKGIKIVKNCRKIKHTTKKICKIPIYPALYYYRKRKAKKFFTSKINDFKQNFELIKDNEYVAVYNSDWLGTTCSTKEAFNSTISINELWSDYEVKEIANCFATSNIKLIIFSAFSSSWFSLIDIIKEKNPEIRIKILWHGDNAMHLEDYDWEVFKKMFEYLKTKKIVSIGFVKRTMYEFYLKKGYNVEFVMNNVHIDNQKKSTKKESTNTKIGLYASGDRWVKNFYNQLAAASLVENAEIDCIPLSAKSIEFSKLIDVHLNGSFKPLKREELLQRMSQNDINIYTTFVECAPMIPLESLELGVPCITGDNHHYWENTELEKYLVVPSVDNIFKIYEKIILCLENREKILKLYKEWKKDYDIKSKESIEKFISN